MTEVVSVKFKGRGKAYYFDANGLKVKPGEDVIVETSKGLEYARCVAGNHYVSNEKVVPPIRPVVRIADDDDKRLHDALTRREHDARGIFREKVAEHGLDMKLVDVECSFEGGKITFYFTSDGRVDFRELVKDLASVFRSRIELRQIGVRDEAKMLGGLGMCGRPLCCTQFLTEFQPVSTKMAKTQSLSLNPTKISGTCGRLMCCLRYEEEAYEALVKAVPKNGAYVETPAGFGTVTQVNLLRGTVKVKLDGDGEAVIKSYTGEEVAAVPGGRPRNGEAPMHVLKRREPEPEAEPDDTDDPVVDTPAVEEAAPAVTKAAPAKRSRSHRSRRGGGGEKPAADKPAERQQGERSGERPRRERPPKPRTEGKPQDARPRRDDESKRDGEARRDDASKPRRRSRGRRGRGGRGGQGGQGGAAPTAPTGE